MKERLKIFAIRHIMSAKIIMNKGQIIINSRMESDNPMLEQIVPQPTIITKAINIIKKCVTNPKL